MKKSVFTVFGSVALVLSLVACDDSAIEPAENKEPEEVAEEVAESAEAVVEEETEEAEEAVEEEEEIEEAAEEVDLGNLKVGDSVYYGDAVVTLNSVRKDEGSADAFFTPDNDYFLVFDVTVDNQGDDPVNISSLLQFAVYDPEGYSQELSIFADTKGSLDGEVGAYRKLAGEIAFDVVDSEYFEFVFSDPFKSGSAIWMVEAADFE